MISYHMCCYVFKTL